jgi:cerevisin
MASPHIAGLTAYYLSLYPSGEFAPTVEDYEVAGVPYPAAEAEESTGRSLFQIGSQFVFGKKPQVTGGFKPLDPKVLKTAMLRLSTKNVLDVSRSLPMPDRVEQYTDESVLTQDISSDTPNLLAFNNFTTSATKAVEDEPEEIFYAQPIYEKGQDMVNNAVEELEDMIEEMLEGAEEQWFSKQ